jgi:hypothetical protein
VSPTLLVAIQSGVFVLAGGVTLVACARRGAPVVRALLAAGLGAGASMHIVALAEDGLHGISGQPLAFNLFWASLAVLDPLAALLLNTKPRAGIAMTLAIMLCDVSVNAAAFGHAGDFEPESWRLGSQVAFGLFAAAAARRVWSAAPASLRRP